MDMKKMINKWKEKMEMKKNDKKMKRENGHEKEMKRENGHEKKDNKNVKKW